MVKDYTCEKCGKEFSQKGHFTNHQKRKRPCKPIVNKVIEEKVQEKLQELSENGEIEIKNKNLISNNQKSNSNKINMDKEYIHSKGQYFTKHETLQKCVIEFILNKPKIILIASCKAKSPEGKIFAFPRENKQ